MACRRQRRVQRDTQLMPQTEGRVDASGEQVVLSAGELRLTVVTEGGGMRELTCGDWAVLDGYGVDEVPLGAYGQTLIPWPNRLAGGRYEFEGHAYQVPLTEPAQNNALHGFARWMTWSVGECQADRARLSLLLHPREGYPFALSVDVDYAVIPTGVSVTTTARNVGRSNLPFANGFHPYLSVGTPSIDDCRLEIPAATWLPTDERQIPTGHAPVEATQCDFRTARVIGSTRLDTGFTDLVRDGDGMARVKLTSPDGSRRVALWMDETYGYVMAYTGDTLVDKARRRRAIGVEPMTAAPNAFQTGEGLRVLAPGQVFVSRWGLEIG